LNERKEGKVTGSALAQRESVLLKASFYNNPFVGLFLRASDKLVAVPRHVPEKTMEAAQAALQVTPFHTSISQSNLLGIFSVMNSKGAVLSCLAEKYEVLEFKKQGLNVALLDPFSPGNNVAANDKAALVSHHLSRSDITAVGDCLGVEVFQHRFATPSIITSISVTNRGFLAHNDLTETELKVLEKMFKVPGMQATVNGGTVFNSLGAVANSNGALVGAQTTGFEVQRIYQALFG